MKPGGGRRKGAGFENEIAKMVVKAFKHLGITRKDCYRTPLSGGHRFARESDPGDLQCSPKLRELFPFSTECKFYKRVPLWHFWLPMKKWKRAWHVPKWLDQTIAACEGSKKECPDLMPLLVFKDNGNPPFCCVPEEFPYVDKLKSVRFKYRGIWWRLLLFKDLLTLMKNHAEELHKARVELKEKKEKELKKDENRKGVHVRSDARSAGASRQVLKRARAQLQGRSPRRRSH